MSRQTGERFERLAEEFLEQNGLETVTRNFRCKTGEIDLIGRDGDTLVFVEVKYRTSDSHGEPLAQVNYSKQRKLIRSALFYCQQHDLLEKLPMRFDVVAIQPQDTQFEIQWLKNAITMDGF